MTGKLLLAIVLISVATLTGCRKLPREKAEEEVARLNAKNKSKCAFWRVGGPPDNPTPVFDESRCQLGKSFDQH